MLWHKTFNNLLNRLSQMRLIYFIILSIFSLTLVQAQQISDGLRYSTEQNLGTARFTALSGAMGALGGDMSAMRNNPAGAAVFLSSSLSISGSLLDVDNKTTYFNHTEKSISDDVNLNQMGAIFVFNNYNEDSNFKKFTIGVNYDVSQSFDNSLFIAGRGNTSIGQFFLAQAQGISMDVLELHSGESISSRYSYLGQRYGSGAQNAFLGYQGYLFDPLDPSDPSNSTYVSNMAGSEFNQEYSYLSRGYNSKLTINLSTQITDDYYFGVNINTHGLDFRRSNYLYETNNHPSSTVNRVGFGNDLSARGSGVSVQFGGIAKVAENLRLGLSWDTPTWYQISEETAQYLESRHLVDGQNQTTVVDPNVINVFADYNLRTPGKLAASAAYVFNQQGFISFDYSYKDYSNIQFEPTNDSYFRTLNQDIKNTLRGASSIRAGGEYRIDELSLRGGFHYEESQYRDDSTLGDLVGFSLGTGYNFGNVTFDLAYSRSEQKREMQLYSVGLTDVANVKTVYSNFIFSLGFIF